MHIRRLRTLGALLLGSALALVVACGGDSPTATPTTAPQATATPVPGDPTATPAPGDPTATPAPTDPTATPVPATATPAPSGEVPNPQSPAGTVVIADVVITNSGPGLNRAQAPLTGAMGVFESLFDVNRFEEHEGGDPTIPWLATEWGFSDDLSKVTIQLQEGVQFHDDWGEMTAEDVAWSLNDVKADVTPTSIHNQAGDHAALFAGEWRVVDTYTVEVDVNIPDPRMFAFNLGTLFQGPSIFSKAHYDAVGEDGARERVVATGPYQVDQWLLDDRIDVSLAFDNHWRDGRPSAERITQLAVAEGSIRIAMLQTGQVDAAEIPVKDRGAMLNQGFTWTTTGLSQQLGVFFSGNLWETHHFRTGEPLDIQVNQGTVNSVPTIGMPNFSNDRMESARQVRRALAMAYDRELINEAILDGLGYAVHHNYFNPNDPNWDEEWEYPYDPDGARALLAEAGFPNGFRTGLYIGPELGGGLGVAGEIGDAVGAFWDQIGVQTEVLKYAYAAFRPSVVGRTNTIPWLTGCDEGRSTLPWDWPKGLVMTSMTRGGFACGFESPWIAENFNKMVLETDIQARTQLANDFLDYIHHWSLEIGVVAVPTGVMMNPNKIEAWPMRLSAGPQINNYPELRLR